MIKVINDDIKDDIIFLYEKKHYTLSRIANKFNIHKNRIRAFLVENGIKIRKKGEVTKTIECASNKKKYDRKNGYMLVAVSKDGNYKCRYNENQCGILIEYIEKVYNVKRPSKYEASKYYIETGDYWYEKYFDIIEVKCDDYKNLINPNDNKIKLKYNKKISLTEEDINTIIDLYQNKKIPIHKIAESYKIGKKRIEKILNENHIERRRKGELKIKYDDNIKYFDLPKKYVKKEGYRYYAISKSDGTKFRDYENKGGHLYHYIRNTLNINTPTVYEAKKYFYETGDYWYEQFFDIVEVEISETKKCPYCDWKTVDLENRSGFFMFHLLREHGISIEEHLKKHPEDNEYFKKQYNIIKRKKELEQEENYVICPICNKKFKTISGSHIERIHKMSIEEFNEKFPNAKRISDTSLKKIREAQKKTNLTVPKRFESKAEFELRDFLTSLGVEHETNRKMLIGKEIDILIPSRKIGIEYDGVVWHTEKKGKKDKNYHLWKTDKCKENGYDLIHIFEYEYTINKEVVRYRLKRMLGFNDGLIIPSEISVHEITVEDLKAFNKKYGFEKVIDDSYLSIGCYDKNELIFVMRFNRNTFNIFDWFENYNYNVDGCIIRTIEYVINKFHPSKIELEIDRRWYYSGCENEFLSVGFKFDSVLPPICKYFNSKVDRVRLFDMEIGDYSDRIWDCGYFKYVLS